MGNEGGATDQRSAGGAMWQHGRQRILQLRLGPRERQASRHRRGTREWASHVGDHGLARRRGLTHSRRDAAASDHEHTPDDRPSHAPTHMPLHSPG